MVLYKGWYFPESNGKGLPEEDSGRNAVVPCAICHAGGWRHTIKAMTIAPTSSVVEHELK